MIMFEKGDVSRTKFRKKIQRNISCLPFKVFNFIKFKYLFKKKHYLTGDKNTNTDKYF